VSVGRKEEKYIYIHIYTYTYIHIHIYRRGCEGGRESVPISAPLSFDFINPRDCRVAKTASRFYTVECVNCSRALAEGDKRSPTPAPDILVFVRGKGRGCERRRRCVGSGC